MSLFDVVTFSPEDVKAVANGTASRSQLWAVVTSQTCGEACWHAREDVCRCSCGGKNHGCLKTTGGEQPVRQCKIAGHFYRLAAVGDGARAHGLTINRQAGFSSAEKPTMVVQFDDKPSQTITDYTSDDIAKARVCAREVWFNQYRSVYSIARDGSPARVKPATLAQCQKWPELAAYRDTATAWNRPDLCWVREAMPERCAVVIIDRDTGLPADDQLPAEMYCQ